MQICKQISQSYSFSDNVIKSFVTYIYSQFILVYLFTSHINIKLNLLKSELKTTTVAIF